MRYSAAGSGETPAAEALRDNAISLVLFLCMAFALLLRFTVSPQLMNLVVNYTTESGSFYEKLHFGTDAIFLLAPIVLFSRPILLAGDEIGKFKALLVYSAVMLFLVPFLFITGRAGSSGFVIDTYLVAGTAGLMTLAMRPEVRRALGDVILAMLILSAVIGLAEALTRTRLLPYSLNELEFRPIGLSAHPLALGALCMLGSGFVPLTRWPVWVRVGSIFVLFIGCAASGARTALLLNTAQILALLMFTRWPQLSLRHERQAKLITLAATAVGGTALTAALFSLGLLNRFNGTIFDENFMARVTIYQVFTYVGWGDILFGMNANDLLAIVNQKLHLPYIESAPVVIILLFGLPIAIVFSFMIFWLPFRLLAGAPLQAKLATIAFLLASLSNNALSSKAPEMAMIVVLLLAYGGSSRPPRYRSEGHSTSSLPVQA